MKYTGGMSVILSVSIVMSVVCTLGPRFVLNLVVSWYDINL